MLKFPFRLFLNYSQDDELTVFQGSSQEQGEQREQGEEEEREQGQQEGVV